MLPERTSITVMARDRRSILLVDDEVGIAEPLAAALEREGFAITVVGTAAEALLAAKRLDPDLVLLDLGLPDGSGFDVCRELRSISRTPVIMLTARGEEADRVAGLELGADDYVVKPFSAREVVARVRAVLRRSSSDRASESGRIEIGSIVLDQGRHSASLEGEPARALPQGIRVAANADEKRRPRPHPRGADRGGVGHELVRVDEDPRRAHELSSEEAR